MVKKVILESDGGFMVPFPDNHNSFGTSNGDKTGLFFAVYDGRLIIVALLASQGKHLQLAVQNMDAGHDHIAAAFNVTNELRALLELEKIPHVKDFFYLDLACTRLSNNLRDGVQKMLDDRRAATDGKFQYIYPRSKGK